MKEKITEKHIRSSIEKGRRNNESWKNFLVENQDPNHPLVDFAKSVVTHTENAIDLIGKKGIQQTVEYLTSVQETVYGFDENTSLSDKAKILSETYPDIPKYLSLMDFLPNKFAEILSGAGFLVMNYQIDPHCYDNRETSFKNSKK